MQSLNSLSATPLSILLLILQVTAVHNTRAQRIKYFPPIQVLPIYRIDTATRITNRRKRTNETTVKYFFHQISRYIMSKKSQQNSIASTRKFN